MRHGANIDPPNRFEKVHEQPDLEHVADDTDYLRARDRHEIEYLPDRSQSIVSENDSPDIPFRYSLNPYRGCVHGCAYCYARPTHEYLGFRAGTDFETKILVKHEAPALFARFLARRRWVPEPIAFSGVTDCYQPAERRFRLTRGCLEVAADCCQPVRIVTKNALIVRDLDVLRRLASRRLVQVFLSVSTLDAELARDLEPRTSIPAARLKAIEKLASHGVPVGLMMAPIVPGLNDVEIPAVLRAAREAGAIVATWTLLRLPGNVQPVFREWLSRCRPNASQRVESLLRSTRGGRLNDTRFGRRMRGRGIYAEQIENTFRVFAERYGLREPLPELNTNDFRPPRLAGEQMRLFD